MSILASDMDGVLVNIEPAISRRIAKHFKLPANEVTKDKYLLHERFGLEFEEVEKFLKSPEGYNNDEVWLEAEPFIENIEALKREYNESPDHRIALVTGRHNSCRAATVKWCAEYSLPWDIILMDTLQVKHRALKFAGAEFFIEDKYSEAKTIAEQGFRSYIIEREYNVRHKLGDTLLIWVPDVATALKMERLYA